MNDTWQKALELNAKFSALEKSYANAAAIAARQARVMGYAPEIMKMASGTSIRMAAAQTANTIHMNSSFLQSFRESAKIVAMHQQIIKPLCINLNAYAEDFRKEKERKTINRNFVLHGMLLRQVDKNDCLQLYLLYYNILSLFAFYDYIWPIKDELWLPSDKSDTDAANSGEEDSE